MPCPDILGVMYLHVGIHVTLLELIYTWTIWVNYKNSPLSQNASLLHRMNHVEWWIKGSNGRNLRDKNGCLLRLSTFSSLLLNGSVKKVLTVTILQMRMLKAK